MDLSQRQDLGPHLFIPALGSHAFQHMLSSGTSLRQRMKRQVQLQVSDLAPNTCCNLLCLSTHACVDETNSKLTAKVMALLLRIAMINDGQCQCACQPLEMSRLTTSGRARCYSSPGRTWSTRGWSSPNPTPASRLLAPGRTR